MKKPKKTKTKRKYTKSANSKRAYTKRKGGKRKTGKPQLRFVMECEGFSVNLYDSGKSEGIFFAIAVGSGKKTTVGAMQRAVSVVVEHYKSKNFVIDTHKLRAVGADISLVEIRQPRPRVEIKTEDGNTLTLRPSFITP